MGKQIRWVISLVLLLTLLASCDLSLIRGGPEPTQGPPPPEGSACAAVSTDQLQSFMNEKLPRMEKDVSGGVVYIDTPQVSNCIENTAYYQLHIGFQREGVVVDLGLTEDSFAMSYDAAQNRVCLNIGSIFSAPELSPQGLEQVGQEVKLADVSASNIDNANSISSMPAETRQRLDAAVGKASIEGVDVQTQGIGPDAAGILMDWAVGELIQRFNDAVANLVGACIPGQ